MFAYFKREIRGLFVGYKAYSFMAIYLIGIIVLRTLYHYLYMLERVEGFMSIEYVLTFIPAIFAAAVPLLTFNVLEEERRRGVKGFLRSLPISASDVFMAKYLSLLSMLVIVFAIDALVSWIMGFFGGASGTSTLIYLVAYFLVCHAIMSIQLLIGVLFKNKYVSFAVSYLASAVLITLVATKKYMPVAVERVVSSVSLIGAFTPALFGSLDLASYILWISTSVASLVLAYLFMKKNTEL